MKYKLAVSPINWRNDDMPELGAENTLEKFFTEAAEIGYDGVEMGAQYPREADELRAMLQPYNLQLASGWYDMGLLNRSAEEEFEAMRPHIELLRAMGCKVVVVSETINSTIHNQINTGVSDKKIMTEEEWQRFTSRLDKLAALMKEINMPLTYHAHIGTVIETEEEIDRMMAECPNVNLLYDTGHLSYAGADPLEVLNRYINRINHIHLKDVRQEVIRKVRSENKSFLSGVMDGSFTVPSDGDIDFDSILRAVFASSYEGWFVVEAEQDPAKAPAKEYAQKAHNYLTSMISNV